MAVVFYSSFVCISAYANVYFKTVLRECLQAGVPSGFPGTAPPPVLVPVVLGTLAVWIPNQKLIIEMSLVRRWFVLLPVCDHSQGFYFPPNTGGGV